MSFVDVIARKRDGHALSHGEIDAFVAGLTGGSIPDYQTSALLMAITLRGMTNEETSWLTDAMVRSGDRVDLSDIPGIKVGKHSTGGVGDKVSLILAPLAAACGAVVPKMSGRGLGHTGGTLDKLESIPGFRVDLSVSEFKRVIRAVGTSIIGQTASLAPADKAMYALRGVTATVESIPLISASIMSKKLAEGSDALVLDVKCGDGAFMKDAGEARALAAAMVAIGARAGVRTEAFVTEMNVPLGMAVGNALEVVECIATLKGSGPPDLRSLVVRLTARMLVLGGVEPDAARADSLAERTLAAGQAAQVFARMIEAQGGDPRVVDDPTRLPAVDDRELCVAARAGYVQRVRAEAVGRASHALGAGRVAVGDTIDHAVGVVMRVRPGDTVERGQPLLEICHRSGRGLESALALCRDAVVVGDAPPPAPRPAVLGEVR
jgi:pyrimidine-nucleoside phosphorylase